MELHVIGGGGGSDSWTILVSSAAEVVSKNDLYILYDFGTTALYCRGPLVAVHYSHRG